MMEGAAVLSLSQLQEGTRFRLARIACGLTLFDVGSRAGVSPPRLSEFERGRGRLSPEAIGRVRSVLDEAAKHAEANHAIA